MSKPMSKPLLYAIFILKFLFGLGLIAWTITMTLSSDVGEDEDNAFLSSYHNVDDNFNKMVNDNYNFEDKYNLKLFFNNEIIEELTIKDVFLSQRVIKERKIRKNILKIGNNTFKYSITTKDGKEVKNAKINMLVTMTTNHIHDKKLDFKDKNIETFDLKIKSYWNITGTIEIGDDKGSFFIKTNSK